MRTIISLILNIIWLLTAGWVLFLGYVLAGIIACIFIVTIPFGVASFRIAGFVLWPFGREVVDRGRATGVGTVGNVIWFVVAGWWLALGHVATAVAQALTIIGIPLAWANLKLIPVTCFPFGKEVVSSSDARARMFPTARP
ncbi:YccF domain-containing protein [Brachybacterium sp. AOP25-B2-12]|uniref:YccF domain-containing protein n=1 Tax=Brachybacterium sp. AOP25-B2-12 TaxID=3457710 RepID=UPI004034E6C9